MLNKFHGFDDSEHQINEDFEPEKVDMHDIFTDEFIQKYTQFSSWDEMFSEALQEHHINSRPD